MSQEDISQFEFELYLCPGMHWSPSRRKAFISELRPLASKCLHPLPDYQCLSYDVSALDDKLFIIARRSADSDIVAFTSAVFLPMKTPQQHRDASSHSQSFNVFHTGLTCISPDIRRQGMTIELFARIFIFMTDRHPEGFWLTNLAEVPSSLVSISHYATQVFPSPTLKTPSTMHLHIAKSISKYYRDALHISPDAVFDENRFVFTGSNPPGSCFRKSRDNRQFHHRNEAVNEFYRNLLGEKEGSEVLQVAYVSRSRIAEANEEEERLHRSLSPLQVNHLIFSLACDIHQYIRQVKL